MDRKSLVQFTHKAENFLNIGNSTYKQWVFRYTFLELEKDLGTRGDISTAKLFRDGKFKITGEFVSRSSGIVAGISEIKYFLAGAHANFKPGLKDTFEIPNHRTDGEYVEKGDVIMKITADVHDLLAAERVILNLLMRMSSVATFTKRITDSVKEFDVLITPTRKTLWGLLDKKAVLTGGGGTHRINLSDAVIFKDTHLDILKRDFTDVFKRIEETSNDFRFLEIEVENINEVVTVAEKFTKATATGKLKTIGVVMMDNMSPSDISIALHEVKNKNYYEDVLFEASGGICEENVVDYAKTGVDVISMGCLTRSVPDFDIGMKISP